jgi:2-iminobutanoate/2-iminopropanoate deaminase
VPESASPRVSDRRAISATEAPQAIGPYSQAIQCGSLIFVSGQIPIDPATGQVIDGDTAEQTRQVLRNLSAILQAAGLSFRHVVKTTVYLKDLGDFGAMNAVYSEFIADPPPARSTVEVARLPRDVRIEIDLIAAQ